MQVVVGSGDEGEHLDLGFDGGSVVGQHMYPIVLGQQWWRRAGQAREHETPCLVELPHPPAQRPVGKALESRPSVGQNRVGHGEIPGGLQLGRDVQRLGVLGVPGGGVTIALEVDRGEAEGALGELTGDVIISSSTPSARACAASWLATSTGKGRKTRANRTISWTVRPRNRSSRCRNARAKASGLIGSKFPTSTVKPVMASNTASIRTRCTSVRPPDEAAADAMPRASSAASLASGRWRFTSSGPGSGTGTGTGVSMASFSGVGSVTWCWGPRRPVRASGPSRGRCGPGGR